MSINVILKDSQTGQAASVNSHGELVVGNANHSDGYSAVRSTAGVTTIVPSQGGFRFIVTAILIASNKTNVETQVNLYGTLLPEGDASTAANIGFSGGLAKNDRVIIPALDLIIKESHFINVETDTAATINVAITGYFEKIRR